jgi:hypothetical protein
VGFGGITVGIDVETVRNRVCVAYTERAADGGQLAVPQQYTRPENA